MLVREAWRRASAQEVARRREEREGEALRGGVVWRWIEANKAADRAKGQIWRVWTRHRARTDWEARVTARTEEKRRRQEEVGRSEEQVRTEAWQGRHEASTRGELRGERRGKVGKEEQEGWTMAAALIVYKKGAQRKEDEEKVRQAQEERARRERARREERSGGERGSGSAEATGARAETAAHEEREGSTAAETRDGLTEEEHAQIDDRVKGMYEGLVRGLRRVLMMEVARYAVNEYHTNLV